MRIQGNSGTGEQARKFPDPLSPESCSPSTFKGKIWLLMRHCFIVLPMIRKIFLDKSKAIHMQFLRYFFVGGSAAVVDLLLFSICLKYFGLHYALAAFLAYMMGLAWNHMLCIFWVFDSKHHRGKEILMILLITAGALLWTWLILYLLIDIAGLDPIISKMVSQILVLFWNFTMRKFYVFH